MRFKQLLLLIGVFALTANAQEAQFEVIIDAVHVRNAETALPITIMDEEEVRNEARFSLGDSLSRQPGINNASFGPAVGQPVIRGQQGRRVMNLTNGMPNTDASGNSADHANTVEPMLATGIEILRGPSTLLYGGGAIGGVINVLDRRFSDEVPTSPSFALEGRHDKASDMNTLVSQLNFAISQHVWHLDFTNRDWNALEIPGLAIHPAYLEDEGHEEAENSDGYIANTGGGASAATIGWSYVMDNGFIGFSVNRMESNYGLPPGAHELHEEALTEEEHGEDIFIDMKRNRYDAIAGFSNISPMLESINYRISHTEYEHAEMEGSGLLGTRFSNDSLLQRLQLTHPEINNWHGVIGLQDSRETFGATGEESFIPITDISYTGLFLVEAFHSGDFIYEFGFRLNSDKLVPEDINIRSRSFSTQSYSGSMLWDVNDISSLGLAFSHSERAPSVEELYSNFAVTDPDNCIIHFATGSCELGNINLGEEGSNNVDLNLYLSLNNLEATITIFYNRFEDYIFQANTGVEVFGMPVRSYMNGDARFYGLELDTSIFLAPDWELRIFGDTIDAKLEKNGWVPRTPPYRLGSELAYDRGDFSAALSVLHAFDQNEPGLNELETDGYTRWDLQLNYLLASGAKGDLTIFSSLRNITDDEIRLSTSFLRGFAPESGRSLELGIRYNF
jgi:iron complex outermembrane receptor protein